MKKLSVTLTLLLIVFCSIGQLQNANWCFGFNAGVNFNTLPPTPSWSQISLSNPGSHQVSASVSDENGNLRFYTDGINVWDKNHTIMENGTGLYGYSDLQNSQQNVVIVPKPGFPEIYYIFTLASISIYSGGGTPVGRGGIHYSVVDMSIGTGKVVLGLKNIPLKSHNGVLLDYDFANSINTVPEFITVRSRMTTSMHGSGDKIWVSIIPDFYYNNQNTRYFYNFLVSIDGINGVADGVSSIPTLSSLLDPSNYLNTPQGIGQMKISPNGQFLCDAEEYAVLLYPYNNQTGNIGTGNTIFNSASSGYGVEFSPNSERLYFTDNPNGIIQNGKVSINKPNPPKNFVTLYQYTIQQQSLTLIYNYPPPITPPAIVTPIPVVAPFGLQLAADNKIYLSAYGGLQQYRNYLGVINAPNILGINCNFVPDGLQLLPNTYNNVTMPQWVHKTTLTIWPKVYESQESNGIKLDNTGNLFSFSTGINMSNNVNHNGVLTNTFGNYLVQYNKATGITNWVAADIYPTFSLSAAIDQFTDNSPSVIYRDGVTGNSISGPSFLTATEKIFAEDNGILITHDPYTHDLNVKSSLINNSITVASYPGYAWYGIDNWPIYNPATKRLYFSRYSYHLGNHIYLLYIYQLNSNNTLTLLNNPLFNQVKITQVNTADEIFSYKNGKIQKYDYLTDTYTPVVIPNFNNVSLQYVTPSNQIVEDRILTINSSDQVFYCINTVSLTSKKITYTNPSSSPYQFYSYYIFDGDDVFISGEYFGNGFTIGNQVLPLLGNASSFVTKFSLQTDFTFRSISEALVIEQKNSPIANLSAKQNNKELISTTTIHAMLSPNPAKNKLLINLTEMGKETIASFVVSITNSLGVILFKQRTLKKMLTVDVSQFKTGIYYMTITTQKGEKITQMFMKE